MKYDSVEQAKNYLLDKTGAAPDIAIMMGSGVSAVDELLSHAVRVHYITIPNCPVPKVAGHSGQAIFGKAHGLNVIVFEGRVHFYEGHSMEDVTFCTRLIGRTGAKTLLLTNAAGAINTSFGEGNLMLISDHINLMGANPLAGPNDERWGQRFLDQGCTYDPDLRHKLKEAAKYSGVDAVEGVYAAVLGPTYETPAEVRYLRAIGADAVGMSTVPEAIVARHMGLKVAGLSLLTNMAAGTTPQRINHDEVLKKTAQMNGDVGMLLLRFFETYVQ
ncbi:MAG TPA: purine-nucleoside phosphorylase [Terriglobia bacterium]|nr:purine-nucleoside phosphorylase [Terriglobia bacterium]